MALEDQAIRTPGLTDQAIASDRIEPSARLLAWAPLAAIVAVFFGLAMAYSVRVPLYEAPDEWAHVKYVESLAFDYELPDPHVTHQAQHPPLYYTVEAIVVRALFLPRPAEQPHNPAFNQSPQEADMYLHPDEAFLWRSDVATVQVMRAVTVLFGVGLVIMTYVIAQLLFPGRRLLALAAAATAAMVPQFAFISAMVNNDVPAGFFAAVSVYAALRFLKQAEHKWLVVSVVFIGLAALTKSAAAVVGIVPMAAVFLVYPEWRQRAQGLALAVGVPALMAGWFYLRNLIDWGNLFVPDDVIPLNGRGLGDPIYRVEFYDQLFDSYWYRGGWMNVRFSPLTYRLLAWVPAFAAAGVFMAFRRGALDRFQAWGLALLAVLPALIFVALVQYSVMQDWGPQGRYFFPVQFAIATLLVFGISTVITREGERDHPAIFALPVVLLLMNIWVFAVKLPDVY